MKSDYEILKDNYGERFAKMCRTLFPTILETAGLLSDIILSHFAPNKYLFEDIEKYGAKDNFVDYIYGIVKKKGILDDKETVITDKSVKELFDEAGYEFYECHSEEDIQKFKKYYAEGEELCTFVDNRSGSHHVFWVVKKDVDQIRREDFKHPQRQDRYGTSVMSIQFSKGFNNYVSIKNRYNHTVDSPDATFSNDLDSIIPGLKYAFESEYGLNVKNERSGHEGRIMPGYVMASDGKYYKVNCQTNLHNHCCYCPDNVLIVNGNVSQLDRERYIVADYFIIDLKEKKVSLLPESGVRDSLPDRFTDIKRIDVKKEKITKNKEILITLSNDEQVIVKVDKMGKIISYRDDYVKEIGNNFFTMASSLTEVSFANLEKVGDIFLQQPLILQKIFLPKL